MCGTSTLFANHIIKINNHLEMVVLHHIGLSTSEIAPDLMNYVKAKELEANRKLQEDQDVCRDFIVD